MNLKSELEKYQYAELTDKQQAKLKGTLSFGAKVSIKWKGRTHRDVGYVFATPECDDDIDMLDVFVHVPEPDNEDGIGDAPAEWCHLNSLLLNEECLEITTQQ